MVKIFIIFFAGNFMDSKIVITLQTGLGRTRYPKGADWN